VLSRYQKEHQKKLVEFIQDSLHEDFASLSTFRGAIFENMSHTLLYQGGTFEIFGPLGSSPSLSNIEIPKCLKMQVQSFQNTPAPIYYLPTSSKFPVIDSWIGCIGFFQITTAKNRKGLKFDYICDYMTLSKKFRAVYDKFYLVIPKERFQKEKSLKEPQSIKLSKDDKKEEKRKKPKIIAKKEEKVNPSELQQYLLYQILRVRFAVAWYHLEVQLISQKKEIWQFLQRNTNIRF
jgi:hypothetical protein